MNNAKKVKGQLNTKIGIIKPGMKIPVSYLGHDTYIKYMAYCDGYIVARWKGAMPFVDDVNGFLSRIDNLSISKINNE